MSKIVANRLIKSLIAQKHNNFVRIINMINVKYLFLPDLGGHEISNSESEDLE